MIAAGRFRTPGIVEQIRDDAPTDASGRVDLTSNDAWTEYWRGRMEVIAITAKERIYANEPVGENTHRVTLRRNERTAQITSCDRVRVNGRTLNITGAIDVGNPPRLIELSCMEAR